jgi:hypothetical protein
MTEGFQPIGYEAELRGLEPFLANLGRMNQAVQDVGKTTVRPGGITSLFAGIGASATGALGQVNQVGAGTIAMGGLLENAIMGLASKFRQFATEGPIQAAGRVNEMNLVLAQLGSQFNQTPDDINKSVQAFRKLGIETSVAQDTLAQFIRYQIKLTDSQKLARIAQDAAVLGNTNSSEAMQRLIWGITTGQTEILRTMGINVNFAASYGKVTDGVKQNVNAMTEQEKVQARVNAVLKEGEKIQGLYEISMQNPIKVMGSMKRVTEEIMINLGQPFQQAFTSAVFSIYAFQHSLQAATDVGGTLRPLLDTVGAVTAVIGDRFRALAGIIPDGINKGQSAALNSVIQFGNDMLTSLGNIATGALQWGVEVMAQFATGIIQGAVEALTAAMNVINSILSSWLEPHSPPKVAPRIDFWGMQTMQEWLSGFTEVDYSVLDSISGNLDKVFSTLVSAGQMSQGGANQRLLGFTQSIMEGLAKGTDLSGVYKDLAKDTGDFGAQIVELIKSQVELARATDAVNKAQEAQSTAYKAVSKGVSEYNKLVHAGADASVLKAKRAEVLASEKAAAASDTDLTAANEKKTALEKQVKSQQAMFDMLQKMAGMEIKVAMPDLTALTNALKGAGKGGITPPTMPDLPPMKPPDMTKVDQAFEDLKKRVAAKMDEIFKPFNTAWEKNVKGPLGAMVESFKTLKQTIKDLQGPMEDFLGIETTATTGTNLNIMVSSGKKIKQGGLADIFLKLAHAVGRVGGVLIAAGIGARIFGIFASPLVGIVRSLLSPFGLLLATLSLLVLAWEQNFLGIQDKLGPAIASLGIWLKGLVETVYKGWQGGGLTGAWAALWGYLRDWWDHGGSKLANDIIGKVGFYINTIWDWFVARIPEWGPKVAGFLKSVWEHIVTWWDTEGGPFVGRVIAKVGEWLPKIWEGIKTTAGTVWAFLVEKAIGPAWDGIVTWWNANGANLVATALTLVWGFVASVVKYVWDNAPSWALAIANGIGQVWTALTTDPTTGQPLPIITTLENAGKTFDTLAGMWDTREGKINIIITDMAGLSKAFSDFCAAVRDLGTAVGGLPATQGILGGFLSFLTSSLWAKVDGTVKILKGLLEVWTGIINLILGHDTKKVREGIADITGGIMQQSPLTAGQAGKAEAQIRQPELNNLETDQEKAVAEARAKRAGRKNTWLENFLGLPEIPAYAGPPVANVPIPPTISQANVMPPAPKPALPPDYASLGYKAPTVVIGAAPYYPQPPAAPTAPAPAQPPAPAAPDWSKYFSGWKAPQPPAAPAPAVTMYGAAAPAQEPLPPGVGRRIQDTTADSQKLAGAYTDVGKAGKQAGTEQGTFADLIMSKVTPNVNAAKDAGYGMGDSLRNIKGYANDAGGALNATVTNFTDTTGAAAPLATAAQGTATGLQGVDTQAGNLGATLAATNPELFNSQTTMSNINDFLNKSYIPTWGLLFTNLGNLALFESVTFNPMWTTLQLTLSGLTGYLNLTFSPAWTWLNAVVKTLNDYIVATFGPTWTALQTVVLPPVVNFLLTQLEPMLLALNGDLREQARILNEDLKTAWNDFKDFIKTEIIDEKKGIIPLLDKALLDLQGYLDVATQKANALAAALERLHNAYNWTPPHKASGGIVTKPTVALVGEAGPEAIIPLRILRQVLGNSLAGQIVSRLPGGYAGMVPQGRATKGGSIGPAVRVTTENAKQPPAKRTATTSFETGNVVLGTISIPSSTADAVKALGRHMEGTQRSSSRLAITMDRSVKPALTQAGILTNTMAKRQGDLNKQTADTGQEMAALGVTYRSALGDALAPLIEAINRGIGSNASFSADQLTAAWVTFKEVIESSIVGQKSGIIGVLNASLLSMKATVDALTTSVLSLIDALRRLAQLQGGNIQDKSPSPWRQWLINLGGTADKLTNKQLTALQDQLLSVGKTTAKMPTSYAAPALRVAGGRTQAQPVSGGPTTLIFNTTITGGVDQALFEARVRRAVAGMVS